MDSRHQLLSRLWIALSVVYGVCRVVAVAIWLNPYGVNPVWFALVEISSSFIYGWATSDLVRSFFVRRSRRLPQMAALAAIAFFAPDIFVIATVHDAPFHVVRIVATIILIGMIGGGLALGSRIRESRRNLHRPLMSRILDQ